MRKHNKNEEDGNNDVDAIIGDLIRRERNI